ncbi:sensor histidine kinase [Nocardioides daphniae]|nr:sensor histidine kinase [Nocardioides daphniae]
MTLERGKQRPRPAAAVAVTGWGLAALSLALLAYLRPPLDENLWFYLVDVVVACVYSTVAHLVLTRRSHPVGWLAALTGVGGGVAALAFLVESWWLEAHPQLTRDDLPALIDRGNSTGWVPGTMALFLVVPWLVRDHPMRWPARVGVAVGVLITAGMTMGGLLDLQALVGVGLVLSIPWGLVTAAAVEVRRRRGPVHERNGLGWLALGTLVMALSFVPLLFPVGEDPGVWMTPVLHLVSQAVFPAAILVAVLRGRMWDLDLVVSRATVVAIVAVALLAIYVAVVVALGRLLPGEGVSQVVAAGAVAVAVQPVRLWATTRVRRLVHGLAADPAQAVRRLGAEIGRDDDDLLPGLARSLAEAMRLSAVRVVAEDRQTELARWVRPGLGPDPLLDPAEVTLEHRGVVVGHLLVSVPPGEAISARDRRVLSDLAGVLAAAVAVSRGAKEVARLRDSLAGARLAERRLIRREIHDGLGPSLAGLRFGVQGVQNLLRTDPEAAARLLDALQAELGERVDTVRELSHHLLPPVLDELGLGPALAELAHRSSHDGLDVDVEVAGIDAGGELPAGVAVTAYGIAVEAVTNVRRHADATHCVVRAGLVEGALRLEVRDDGVGIAPDRAAGVGTRSMHERAEEIGGRVEVVSAPGEGTLVTATLPLRGADLAVREVAGG